MSRRKPTKVKMAYLEDGTRVRISRKSGALIPKPAVHKSRLERGKEKVDGQKDTPTETILQQTYFGEDFQRLREEWLASIQTREELAKHLVFPS